jgi:hypothetical protein
MDSDMNHFDSNQYIIGMNKNGIHGEQVFNTSTTPPPLQEGEVVEMEVSCMATDPEACQAGDRLESQLEDSGSYFQVEYNGMT